MRIFFTIFFLCDEALNKLAEIKKKAGSKAGLQSISGSVSRDDWAAEFVVHPHRNHVDVLADRIGGGGADCTARERVVRITHHQMVVLDAGRHLRIVDVMDRWRAMSARVIEAQELAN
jgi:hypothetical protein